MKKPFKAILFIFLLFPFLQSFSQTVDLDKYSFINYNENKIEFYGKSQDQFNPLFEKIKKTIALGSEQIRVLHIGDKQVRDELFAYKVYSNLSSTLSGLESRRGMLWDAITKLKPKEEIVYEIVDYDNKEDLFCQSFRLYHSPIYDSINIFLKNIESSYKTIYYADKGYTHFELKNPTKTINLSVINNSSKSFTIYGYYLETKNSGFIYDILARNSTNLNQYHLDNILQNQLQTMSFDMVIISFGENEAYSPAYFSESFKSNLSEIINKFRENKPNIPIILTTPHDSYVTNKPNNRLELATKDIIEVASKSNCAIWNFYKIMGSKGSSENWSRNNLMDSRKTVLTNKGSSLEGDLFYNAIWQSFENYINKIN